MLFLNAVEPRTLSLLKRLQALPVLADTRLVGGTALAMQLGHRISVDRSGLQGCKSLTGGWRFSTSTA